MSQSPTAAELPVVDVDIEGSVADSTVLDERCDRLPVLRLHGQRDSYRLGVVRRAQSAVEDQPLTQGGRQTRQRGWRALRASDDEEPWLVGGVRELPHRASEQVFEAPDEMLSVH